MSRRKAMMFESADAFCVLPGGFGTLDEFFELLALTQRVFQGKPIFLLNMGGFFDDLLAFLAGVRDRGFIASEDLARSS
jgi:uncharacterized protein (TIGR00730 family)